MDDGCWSVHGGRWSMDVVRCSMHACLYVAIAQPSEVGQYKVDAMHIGVGEHETTVDEQDFIVLLDRHAVTANFA